MKTSYRDAELQIGYITYMIVGSYFKKAICRTPAMEAKMKLYYHLMNEKDQLRAEEDCDRFAAEKIVPLLPEAADSETVEVSLRMDGETAVVEFSDGIQRFEVRGEARGRRTDFSVNVLPAVESDALDSAPEGNA